MAVLAFTLWVAAEYSDIVRGALESVPKHQIEAGEALGLNDRQLFWYVSLPQAFQLALPGTINLATRVIKTTSLLMLISVMDVINIGQQIIEANNNEHPTTVFWVYGLIFILYFIVDYPLSWWERRLRKISFTKRFDRVRKKPKKIPKIPPKRIDKAAIQTEVHKPPISRAKLCPAKRTLIPECAMANPPFKPI